MKIYTKTGDKGETGLFGGVRISKSSERIDAYGTIDELNSFIGLTITEIKDEEILILLEKIQNQLFSTGSDLSTPYNLKNRKLNIVRVQESYSEEIEKEIDKFEEKLLPLKNFILPGGTKSAAFLHVCRTICRRAERKAVSLSKREKVNNNIITYLNRLSDLFFVLSRYENKIANIPDVIWQK
ncbi:MAG TPA: cob(I)yrinic acid a,c-diamide adenosyltransferase [Ignavibacteria bacterium]|nr:cob(I)yrinic acid a,c-diamide adenosyltransferase [Ignavibacteria bacterium]